VSSKLHPVITVLFPSSLTGDPFSCRNGGEGAQDGNRFLATLHLHFEDTEAVLLVVEGNPFHLSAQGILRAPRKRLGGGAFAERTTGRH